MDRFQPVLDRKWLVALAVVACLGGNLCGAVKKDSPGDHVAVAYDQLEHCDPGGAIAEFNLAVRLKPSLKRSVEKWLAASHFMLAERMASQGDYPVALAELQKALELRPKEAYWHLAKAMLEARTGNAALARTECGLAVQLEKKDPGLEETCKNPGAKISYFFVEDKTGPAADPFAELEAVKSDATSAPFAYRVPDYRGAWPGSMVAIVATIGTDGKVQMMQVVKPMGLGLDQKALKILRRSRFQPAMRRGTPVETRALITILFGPTCHK